MRPAAAVAAAGGARRLRRGILPLVLGLLVAGTLHVRAADPVTLDSGRLRVTVAPERGGSLLAFSLLRGDDRVDLIPDATAAGARPSSWLMLPYSNRVRDGRFSFEGREHRLRSMKNHAIHGDVRNRPWSVVEQSPTSLVLAFDSREAPDFDWPWPIRARAAIDVGRDALVQTITLENRGETTMPAGFGWHPYFRRFLTREGEPVELAFRATGIHPDTNADGLPDGPTVPLSERFDFSRRKPVAADGLDACFAGFDGRAELAWPESHVRLLFECSPNATHLVCYAPADRPVIAVEPAANANDGVNLLASGATDSGIIPLAPGATLEASFTLRVVAE